MSTMEMICDSCNAVITDRKEMFAYLVRRPSDPTELCEVLAQCKDCVRPDHPDYGILRWEFSTLPSPDDTPNVVRYDQDLDLWVDKFGWQCDISFLSWCEWT